MLFSTCKIKVNKLDVLTVRQYLLSYIEFFKFQLPGNVKLRIISLILHIGVIVC